MLEQHKPRAVFNFDLSPARKTIKVRFSSTDKPELTGTGDSDVSGDSSLVEESQASGDESAAEDTATSGDDQSSAAETSEVDTSAAETSEAAESSQADEGSSVAGEEK